MSHEAIIFRHYLSNEMPEIAQDMKEHDALWWELTQAKHTDPGPFYGRMRDNRIPFAFESESCWASEHLRYQTIVNRCYEAGHPRPEDRPKPSPAPRTKREPVAILEV